MEIPPVAVAGAPEAYPLVTSPATESGDNLSSTLVTVEQQAAISALKEFDQDTVFAWLIFARSIEHVFHHRSAPGGLSAQQLHAISTLRDCDDRNIIDWMRNVALAGKQTDFLRGVRTLGLIETQKMSTFPPKSVALRLNLPLVLRHGSTHDSPNLPQDLPQVLTVYQLTAMAPATVLLEVPWVMRVLCLIFQRWPLRMRFTPTGARNATK